MDLSKYNCLVFIFMSHGNTENIVEVTDEPMGVSEFWTSFVSCKTLQGKPKLFIFQVTLKIILCIENINVLLLVFLT